MVNVWKAVLRGLQVFLVNVKGVKGIVWHVAGQLALVVLVKKGFTFIVICVILNVRVGLFKKENCV